MKNLYTKSKAKKIHPSPATATSAGGDVLAVLKLLPAAILVLTAALRDEDKEVLAYLVTRAMSGGATAPVAGDGEERRQCVRRGASASSPVLDCGCFDCYTRFWSRWDGSPDREVIHQAIEAFEEHLARSEREAGRGRRREKGKKGKDKASPATEAPPPPPPPVPVEDKRQSVGIDESPETATMEEVTAGGGSGERRRGWADVMGVFNSRLWSIWSPRT